MTASGGGVAASLTFQIVSQNERCKVMIVGGGPAGLVTAIELGRRGVPCTLFETNAGPPGFPKANATTPRTMEHYRRLGIADQIRELGLPGDYPLDISYHTRFARHELARLHRPSRRDNVTLFPSPEPMLRGQQMFIEPVLKRHAEKFQSVELHFGCRVEAIEQDANQVRAQTSSGTVTADYAVGCDGPRSLVREALGIRYEGIGAEDRQFMGGRMLAVHLDAPAFYELVKKKSWQYWAINPQRFGVLVSIDGRGKFVFHTQLPRGEKGSIEYAKESLAIAMGAEIPYSILGIQEWTAGFMLVAQRYRAGRVFLAGDAAHLFTPTAGQGYNTSVDDAVNLGWKLAALCQGWGGEKLLESYEAERKPVAQRNTAFARSIAQLIGELHPPQTLEEDAAVRSTYGERLQELGEREFHAPGIYFGAYYGLSPVVAGEPGDSPADDPHRYVPEARPGARAPHVWLASDVALYDRFGQDFTLLKLESGASERLERAFHAREVPLSVLQVDSDEARALYKARLIVVRPDHHVAWRGDVEPDDPARLVDRIAGK
jgi:2-polyprenyl-6-methoxyphenol hydroxylase-like FAD-dependent oxidoreductase